MGDIFPVSGGGGVTVIYTLIVFKFIYFFKKMPMLKNMTKYWTQSSLHKLHTTHTYSYMFMRSPEASVPPHPILGTPPITPSLTTTPTTPENDLKKSRPLPPPFVT